MSRPPNPLQNYFNRTPYLAARELGPGVQGIMDVSAPWPLPLQVQNIEYTASVGDNRIDVVQPAQGFHTLVTHLSFAFLPGGGGVLASLTLRDASKNFAVGSQALLHIVDLVVVPALTLGSVVHVGGSVFDNGVQVAGLTRPVYVPFPFSLMHLFASTAADPGMRIEFVSLTLPETQPFSSLLALG